MYFSFHNLLEISRLSLEGVKRIKLPLSLEIQGGRKPRSEKMGMVSVQRNQGAVAHTPKLAVREQEARHGGLGNRISELRESGMDK